MFYEEENALSMFVRYEGYTYCILVRTVNGNIILYVYKNISPGTFNQELWVSE